MDRNAGETSPPVDGSEQTAAEAPETEAAGADGAREAPQAAETTPARRGEVGEEIYEQVEQLVTAGKIRRTEAFRRIAEQTGRREGTVAANYYRVARKRGQGRPRRAHEPRGDRRRTRTDAGSATGALGQLRDALEALGSAIKSQEQELQRLRADREQLTELRRLVGGTGRRRRS